VLPTFEKLDPFLGDLFLLEEHREQFLTEEFLHWREVQILGRRVENAITGEDAECREGMAVWVEIDEVAEGLRRDHHSRDGVVEFEKVSSKELLRSCVGAATEIPVELSVPKKRRPEHLGYREDELGVRYVRQDLLDHALSPEQGALLPATRTQRTGLSRERHKPLGLVATV
jgi:hypothetical protein